MQMEVRYATNPREVKSYDTEQLRNDFLIERLFSPDEIHMVYSHEDRMIVGGVSPVTQTIQLEGDMKMLGVDYFLDRREIGIINIGGSGTVSVDGESYTLASKDCLYVGKGSREVHFANQDAANPAKYYFISTPAHTTYPTVKADISKAQPNHLGTLSSSNERTIYKYIHPEGIQSCQLVMGMTILKPNNMWNTMPSHTHDRRSEIYLYFDVPEDSAVFHFMGQPNETRHLVVRNEQAVISPCWSIHSGVGTSNYTFIWAMGGDNQSFSDMDMIAMKDLR
ncbi:MAG: 5-dehydro-4-deoxy-D-glucuronate isomerase [Paenibacillus sp. RIFOXYA1_FULL_44_5]|nr:MAG: 5-dehydro-4-deoxy-D-glucuronate isomerase [Paenibacillus sp. RIFOXYA1_FULL_44_5]